MTAEVSLILYAVPLGPIAERLDEFWRETATIAPNAAHDYPPHCTVTGFFHRRPDDIGGVCAAVDRALEPRLDLRPTIRKLSITTEWIGFELDAPGLVAFAERFAASAPRVGSDDPIRPKDWPHLSLAYEHDPSATPALGDKARFLPIDEPWPWELRLYQGARGGPWRVLAAWPIA